MKLLVCLLAMIFFERTEFRSMNVLKICIVISHCKFFFIRLVLWSSLGTHDFCMHIFFTFKRFFFDSFILLYHKWLCLWNLSIFYSTILNSLRVILWCRQRILFFFFVVRKCVSFSLQFKIYVDCIQLTTTATATKSASD